MSQNKNQHYVPKFLIKQFSDTDHKKSINIYNFENDKLIFNGSLVGQCKKEFFYGHDLKIENSFMDLEGVISEVLYKIKKDPDQIKNLTHDEKSRIFEFFVFQQLRTVGAINQSNELADKLTKTLHKKDKRINSHLEDFKIEYTNPVLENLKIATQIWPTVFDLEIAILETTDSEFILSDNPVFTLNPFLTLKNWHGSGLGLGCIGIIIILPISPKQCLCLYDSEIYKLNKKHFHPISKIDTEIINSLSLIYCVENCYFYTKSFGEDLRILKSKFNINNKEKFHVEEIANFHIDGKENNKNSTLVKMGKIINISTILRSIPFSNKAINHPLSKSMDISRDYVKYIRSKMLRK